MKDEMLVPDLQLSVKGADPTVVKAIYRDLADVSVHQQLGLVSEFTLKLYTWDTEKIRYGWVDESTFALGKEIEIDLGYANSTKSKVMIGDVTDLSLSFDADQPPMLTVRGQDRGHRLGRTERTFTYHGQTFTQIASTIASRYGLSFEGEDTQLQHEEILQDNVTDLAFLNQLASQSGAQISFLNGKLEFVSFKREGPADLTLKAGVELLSFNPQVTSRGRVGAVKVVGATMGGVKLEEKRSFKADKTGTRPGDELYEKDLFVVMATDLLTAKEVSQRVDQEIERLKHSYVTASGTCIGMPGLKPGLAIKVSNVGKRFSGIYRLTSVTHSMSPTQGYRSSFQAIGDW